MDEFSLATRFVLVDRQHRPASLPYYPSTMPLILHESHNLQLERTCQLYSFGLLGSLSIQLLHLP